MTTIRGRIASPAPMETALTLEGYRRCSTTSPAPLPFSRPPVNGRDEAGLLAELARMRPAWMAEAACRGADPDLFFAERGERLDRARAICAECPVAAECLEYALTSAEVGVWGGTSERQRRRIRRAQPKQRTHGRVSTYKAGCRCAPCVIANSEYIYRYRAGRAS